VPLCEKLLEFDWCPSASMAESRQGNKALKRAVNVSFVMEFIILMCSCIWTARNGWLCNGEDPEVDGCKQYFKKEFALVILRAKSRRVQMARWHMRLCCTVIFFFVDSYYLYLINPSCSLKNVLWSDWRNISCEVLEVMCSRSVS
jgi:hypothetical protein